MIIRKGENDMVISISNDFSQTPGGRYIKEGKYSGEEFRNKILEPKYKECLGKNEKLTINFDGGYGYGNSFLEESFGGLVRMGYDTKKMLENMIFISEEEKDLVQKVTNYIKNA